MKKTHRAVLSILLVLALLATLPLTAMAEGETVNQADNETLIQDYNENLGNNVTVSNGVTVGTNYGLNMTNNGTVSNNGPFRTWSPTITNNNGTVKNNNGPSSDSAHGGIVENNALGGIVENNQAGGIVKNNQTGGTIQSNSGLVGEKNEYGSLTTNSTSGNHGIVTNNNAGGEVCNREGGEVTYNSGRVENYGGTVVNNKADGTVQYNEADSTVTYNHGTVGTANTQGANGNLGTVEYNYIDGVVYNIEDHGKKGTVTTNFGTVYQNNSTADGTTTTTNTNTYYGLHGEDEDGNKYYYKDIDENESDNTAFLGYQANAEVDLDRVVSQYKREGYKLVSYTPYTYSKDSSSEDHLEPQTSGNPIFVGEENDTNFNSTSYYITAPTLLKLTWEKIASIFTPAASTDSSVGGGAEAVPSSYNPKYIGLGSVIFINEKGYKVVEIKDDAYVVVSFDALPDEDVQDLDALYAKLFTPEQQKLIKNVGQLLDSEDVLAVFGTPGNHPVYEISKDLVK